jgi:hypothetical protein
MYGASVAAVCKPYYGSGGEVLLAGTVFRVHAMRGGRKCMRRVWVGILIDMHRHDAQPMDGAIRIKEIGEVGVT